ncbi:MAG TPA: hypothetical protein PLJ33_01230 [Peptococcaceae bacterium]|nr:hypothetical protein [Peptococcaceae bacterium]
MGKSFLGPKLNSLRKKNQGSLTVEACLALPVFLCFFFLLLFFVKIACINIELDHAVKDTARQLAASAYPLRFANDYLDSQTAQSKILENFIPKEADKAQGKANQLAKESLITMILTGEAAEPDLEKCWQDIGKTIQSDLEKGFQGMIVNHFLPALVELKSAGQYLLVQEMLEKKLAGSTINRDKLQLKLVELPQGKAEYQFKKAQGYYDRTGLQADQDFDHQDAIVQVEYAFSIPLPFFGQQELFLRHTAVEKAWLKGSNGIYTAARSEEKVDLTLFKDPEDKGKGSGKGKDREEEDQEVYVCKSDTPVYHTLRYCDYLGSQIIIMTKKEAEQRGKRPHQGCPHRFK